MCRVALLPATFLAITLGAPLNGQTIRLLESESVRPLESELIGRLDSLSAILSRADSVAEIAEGVRKEDRQGLLTARVDTFPVGPFHVVAPSGQVGLARQYFERAWARYTGTVGAESTAIDGHVFFFGKKDALLGLDLSGRTRVSLRYIPRLYRERVIARMLGGVLAADLPDDLRAWTEDRFPMAEAAPGSRDKLLPSALEQAYKSLVVTSSTAVADCYDGALDRCWDALGLDHRDEWITVWYTPSERLAMVRGFATSVDPRMEGIRAGCLDARRDDACSALLVDREVDDAIPLPTGTRLTLLEHALSLGGPQAYARLVADADETIKDRLIRVSGVSADSLISSWRAAVFQARPAIHGDMRRIRWSSLFWLLALAGISTRSTRWRLT